MKKRILYLDILRIISMFAVILLHTSATNWYDTPVNSTSWQFYNIYDSLARFGVPIFIMISGSLFLDLSREISIKKLYQKNIFKIIIIFIFWSLFYNLYEYRFIIESNQFFEINNIKNFIIDLFTGYYHMWFLYVIAGLYMITPLLRKIICDKKIVEYTLILTFFCSFVINLLVYSSFISEIVNKALIKTNINFITGYVGYFILGYYLSHYQLTNKTKKIIYFSGILSVIFTIIMTSYISIKNNFANEFFYNNLLPNTLFYSMSIFILIKDAFSKKELKKRTLNIISNVASLSFGIYLIHIFIIIIMKNNNITPNNFNAFISVPILSIMTFAISYILVYIISKIPLLNKYII